MHLVFQIILAFLGAGLVGGVSAAFVLLIAQVFGRGRVRGTRLEMTFGVAGLVGFALMLIGKMVGSRLLAAASALLVGWVVLPIFLLPIVMGWRLVVWCRRPKNYKCDTEE
jgi:hypothetical protein